MQGGPTKVALSASNDADKLAELASKTYKEQCIWFLNAFWTDFGSREAEKIWAYKHKVKTPVSCGLC